MWLISFCRCSINVFWAENCKIDKIYGQFWMAFLGRPGNRFKNAHLRNYQEYPSCIFEKLQFSKNDIHALIKITRVSTNFWNKWCHDYVSIAFVSIMTYTTTQKKSNLASGMNKSKIFKKTDREKTNIVPLFADLPIQIVL